MQSEMVSADRACGRTRGSGTYRKGPAEGIRIRRQNHMPRITDFVFVTQKEQIVFSVRTITKAEDLPAVIGQSYRKISAYLKEMGVFMTDVPFTAYHNTDMQNLDVEIGFPVSGALPPRDDMERQTFGYRGLTALFSQIEQDFAHPESPLAQMHGSYLVL